MSRQTECGFCDDGRVHDPACRREGMHTCKPVVCPYCHGSGAAPSDPEGDR